MRTLCIRDGLDPNERMKEALRAVEMMKSQNLEMQSAYKAEFKRENGSILINLGSIQR